MVLVMRALLPWLLLLCFSRIGDARDSSRIDGLVLDDATGAPVGKAVVLLDSGSAGPELRRYGAVTESSGRFSVPEIDPGKYAIKVERAGYLSPRYGVPLDIPAGLQSIAITLKLTREGIVSGKVTGPAALPSAPYQLKLWKTTFSRGYRMAEPLDPVSAAADGSFMVGNLAPGRYFLEKPGLSLGDATVLDVAAGDTIRGIRIRQQPVATYRISGVARNPAPAARMDDARVFLESKDPSGSWVSLRSSAPINRQTGAFTFGSIPQGDYRIGATISVRTGSSSRKYSGAQEVHVRGRSATDVSLVFTPMAVVTGTISEEAGLPTRSQPLYVTLYGNGLDTGVADSAQVTPKRTFRLQVTPGRHRVFAGNGSENVRFVKSIRFNGRETTADSPLEVSPEGGNLEIVFGGPGREIVGTIRDPEGRSAAGAVVAAWTDDGALRTAGADAAGRFTILNAPHGRLYVAAWEYAEGAPWEMPSFRSAFQGRAVEVPAQSPFHFTVELVAIPRVVSEAEVMKLR
jgi:hypothetical protein